MMPDVVPLIERHFVRQLDPSLATHPGVFA